MRPWAASLALLAACATPRPAPPAAGADALLRPAELARVRCLLVAPLENASDVSLAGEAATAALLSAVDEKRIRTLPANELRTLFRDTPFELPRGVPPSMALELAEILGADAALFGAVEGRAQGGDPSLRVTLRLALVGPRDLLFASSQPVSAQPGESPESAIRRTADEAARGMAGLLGSPPAPGCFDRARLAQIRALAAGQSAVRPPPAAAPKAEPARAEPAASAPGPKNPRQAEWARHLAAKGRFVVDGVAFEGRSPRFAQASPLMDLASALAAVPAVRVRIEGFVDATPDPGKDAELSMAMAQAAGQRLVILGVNRERVSWAGRGGERPLLPNFTARGRAANRRLEVVVLQ